MIIDFDKLKIQQITNMRDGFGEIEIKKFEDAQKMIAYITIPSQSSIGFHKHSDDEEVIYVISGQGLCREDQEETIIRTGLVNYCPKGKSHSIVNNSLKPLKILAIITKSKN